ncbi:uncharacterized protein LOC144457462 [Phascolarctos cinereus]
MRAHGQPGPTYLRLWQNFVELLTPTLGGTQWSCYFELMSMSSSLKDNPGWGNRGQWWGSDLPNHAVCEWQGWTLIPSPPIPPAFCVSRSLPGPVIFCRAHFLAAVFGIS